MAFLSSVAGYVVTALISALSGWLLKMLHSWQMDRVQAKQDEAKNEANRVALENAKTPAERESAAKGVADGF